MTVKPSNICLLCDNKFDDSASLAAHVADSHHSEPELYNLVYGNPASTVPNYTCQKCLEEFPHTRNHITQHLLLLHDLTPKEYESKLDEFREDLNRTFSTVHHTSPSTETRAEWDQSFWLCTICQKAKP